MSRTEISMKDRDEARAKAKSLVRRYVKWRHIGIDDFTTVDDGWQKIVYMRQQAKSVVAIVRQDAPLWVHLAVHGMETTAEDEYEYAKADVDALLAVAKNRVTYTLERKLMDGLHAQLQLPF